MQPRSLRILGPLILVGAAFVAVLAGLAYGGGAAPLELGDPGPLVRWGLPLTQLVVNLGLAGIIGPLAVALFALQPKQRAYAIAMDVASISAAVFTVAVAGTGFLTFINVMGTKPSLDNEFGQQLGEFLTRPDGGMPWLFALLFGAVITVLLYAARGWMSTFVAALLAIAAVYPLANQGHSGDLENHNIAVSAIALHTAGAAVWIGGLVTVVIVRPQLKKRITDVLLRYSTIALIAFIIVAVSGIARAIIDLNLLTESDPWIAIFSPYGILIIVKSVLLVAMGFAGAMYRQRLIARTRTEKSSRPFWTLVLMELVLMGLASGVATALSRTPSPAAKALNIAKTPAARLTGSDVPPELTPIRWLTQWNIDILWLVAIAFAAFFYFAGVRRLHKRGDRWPVSRTILWCFGLLMLLWVTCGPTNAYNHYLFSVHMLGHMLLTMTIPLALIFGAPITLALRSIEKRRDGTRGAREWILWIVHSPFSRVVTHPLVAAAIFIGSLWVFYFTDLFRWALYDHLGHEWMTAHFLISGYLFVLSLIGIDPIPYRLPYPGRLITLIAVAAMHSFFGIAIMMQSGLMVAEYYGSMGRTWGPTPLEDQYIAGGIAWSIGEIPTMIVAIAVAIQWSRSDDRQQRSRDRQADRSGEAELAEYNAKLAKLAERDARRGE